MYLFYKALYLSGFQSLKLQRQLHQVQNLNRFTDYISKNNIKEV